jgi:glutamine synthetase
MADDKGHNLLNPGSTPESNLQFLAVLVSVLRAVYQHADLLRASVAHAGNEHRLGANEAPPAIISVFLGEQLSRILDTIEKGKKQEVSRQDIMNLGVATLPVVNKDMTDRNRTSPFAFTGNKFEFRAVGSSQNISTPIAVLNTIVADSLDFVRAKIEAAAKSKDFNTAVLGIISDIIRDTKKVRFEGNNYSQEWKDEAANRGLQNEPSTAESLKALIKEENLALFERYKVFSREELRSRYKIWLEMYIKVLEIEAKTLNEMVNSCIVPNAFDYQGLLTNNLTGMVDLKEKASLKFSADALEDLKTHLSEVTDMIYYVRKNTQAMMKFLQETSGLEEEEKTHRYFHELKAIMEHIRKHVDLLECVISDEHWDLPKYREMLFVK